MTDKAQQSPETLVMRLRRRFGVPEDVATDQQVLDATEDTYGRALVDLEMASEKFGDVLGNEIRQMRARMCRAIGQFFKIMTR